MDIAERFEVDAPVDLAWPHLRDIDAVAACFPGAELTGEDAGTYAGRIAVKFGPTTATFAGTARITVDDATRTATIAATGKDRRGSSRASAEVTVRAAPRGSRTSVEIDGTIDVTGPLGTFASAGGAHITRVLLSDFAAAMSQRIGVPEPADAGPPPAAAPPAPLSVTNVLRRSLAAWFRRLLAQRRSRGATR